MGSHVVDYFTGSKAVDMLMTESPFAGQDNLFDCREKCVEFLDTLLRYKMFHRAKKIAVNTEDKKKSKKSKDDAEDSKTETDTDAGNETGCETGGEEAEKSEKTEK